eukprot:1647957-Rhodomonas_salina.1
MDLWCQVAGTALERAVVKHVTDPTARALRTVRATRTTNATVANSYVDRIQPLRVRPRVEA